MPQPTVNAWHLTPSEFAQRSAAPTGCAYGAAPFEASPPRDGSVIAGVEYENQKPEKVSLSVD